MGTDVWGLVPAAGRGSRFGGGTPKLLVVIRGRPILAWTIERLLASGVRGLSIALPADWPAAIQRRLSSDPRVRWTAGGESRQASVTACLRACPEEVSTVMVHDGARPAVAVEDIRATLAAANQSGGAILARPVADTLKRVASGRILRTVDRRQLMHAETPQVFPRQVLELALERARIDAFRGTDDASLVERLPGMRVRVVTARHPNPKLTECRDLPWVEAVLTADR